MFEKKLIKILLFVGILLCSKVIFGQNPFITHVRTADPSAQIWKDGKVWVYTSHDQDWATDYSSMDGYRVFSSYDMVNWTDHGEIFHSRDVLWGVPQGGWMFAPDAAYKDGTYYLYFPHIANGWQWRVGVATSDKPEGPFTDIGRYIDGTDHIDPTCFIDDDGIAYLMWSGNDNEPKIARLKDNMTELAEEPRIIDFGSNNFGEGPYMHKRNGIYYFSWTCNTCYPDQGYYSMGDNPYGPFEYKGAVNTATQGAQDHHSMIEYHGQWYYFYHVGNYGPEASMFRRNVCVDSLFYNEDGTMKKVVQTTKGVDPDLIGSTQGHLIPGMLEAEELFRHSGVDVSDSVVTNMYDGDWIEYVLDILGTETYTMTLDIYDPVVGTELIFMIDDKSVDTLSLNGKKIVSNLFLFNGKHTLKIIANNINSSENLLDIDKISFSGNIVYHKIISSATTGGIILPEGESYVSSGGDIEYSFEQDINYRLENILVDGNNNSPDSVYKFVNVVSEHNITAEFVECEGTQMIPSVSINNSEPINESEIVVTEGDSIILSVKYEGNDTPYWIYPTGIKSNSSTISINTIRVEQGGTYRAILVKETGCKSKQDISITVDPIVLDVYQAENWILQSGVQTEVTSDIGGGLNVGWIQNNDWCEYEISIDTSGQHEIIARVATNTNGGRIEITIDSILVSEIPVEGSKSSGWQDWYTTDPVYAIIEKGLHTVRLTFKGSSEYLFNINWFDINLAEITDTQEETHNFIPHKYELKPVYPNPFNPSARIEYSVAKKTKVSLRVFDSLGRHVKTLLDQVQSAGDYDVEFSGTNLASGVYYYRMDADNYSETRKMVLLK